MKKQGLHPEPLLVIRLYTLCGHQLPLQSNLSQKTWAIAAGSVTFLGLQRPHVLWFSHLLLEPRSPLCDPELL